MKDRTQLNKLKLESQLSENAQLGVIRYLKMHLSRFYTGCHKYVPIDQRLNFRAHRGYNLKRSTARCAKIKELDLATLGTQTASIFTLRFAKNA